MTKKRKATRLIPALPAADKYLLWVVIGLAAIGVVAVYSAVGFLAETKADGHTGRFLFRHLAHLGLALGLMGVFSMIDYRWIAQYSRPALLVATGLLVLVQLFGITSGGAERALQVGFLMFQPAEFAKVALLTYLAVLLAKKQEYIQSFSRAFTPLFAWIILVVVLIGIEDLSTASLVLMSAVLMCFVARVHVAQLASLAMLTVTLAIIFLLVSPARMNRVEEYLGVKLTEQTEEAEAVPVELGYQAKQARIAFAMGGLTGRGPGKSTQRDFLPAPYNDFIFAIIVEEYGVIGGLLLLALFTVFLFRGYLRIARPAADPLGLILGVGLTTIIVLYGFVHAGVNSGVFPVTGLPMPFVSYGGSSLVANGIIVGILLNISRHRAGR